MGELAKDNGASLLLRRLLAAIPEARQTRRDFVKFTETLEAEEPEELALMKQELDAWTLDKRQPDPYRLPKSSEYPK